MELTHIKYFLEVARTEHVTQSAKNLCIVQPALTHAIHRLEDELGVKLFKTSGRNIKLTEAGDYFYKKVKPLYEDIEALPARLRAKSDKQAITVSVKVLAASSFVANAIILYKKQSPALRFYLVQKEESSLYDICVQTYSNYRPQENPDEETFVCSENIYLAVPNTAQYKKRDSISLHELGDTNFIGLYGSKQLHKICDDYCERIGERCHCKWPWSWILAGILVGKSQQPQDSPAKNHRCRIQARHRDYASPRKAGQFAHRRILQVPCRNAETGVPSAASARYGQRALSEAGGSKQYLTISETVLV